MGGSAKKNGRGTLITRLVEKALLTSFFFYFSRHFRLDSSDVKTGKVPKRLATLFHPKKITLKSNYS